jgi:hypothetical protein
MFGMFLLTLAVTLYMFVVRFKAVRSGQVPLKYFKTYDSQPTEDMIKASRHFNNLFEIPVLYYAAMILAIVMGLNGKWVHTWAWTFLIARVAHAIIHLSSNKLMWRMRAYSLGWIALTGLWVTLLFAVYERV